jgi:hypothetical protein
VLGSGSERVVSGVLNRLGMVVNDGVQETGMMEGDMVAVIGMGNVVDIKKEDTQLRVPKMVMG